MLQRVSGALQPLSGKGAISGAGVKALYADSTAAAGGDGSRASPYDDFTEINVLAAAGTLDNSRVRLARGSQFFDQLVLTGTTGVTVEPYGTGNNPIIDGSTVLAGTWTKVGNVYSHPTETVARNLTVDGLHMTGRTTAAQAVTATDTHGFDGCMYVTGAVLTVYANPTDLSTATEIRMATVNYPLLANNTNGCTIKNIDVQMATTACLGAFNSAINLHVDGGVYRWSGDNGDIGNGITINGVSGTKGTGNVVENVSIYGTTLIEGNPQNGIEINFQTGFVMRDCSIHDCGINGIELFDGNVGSRFDRVKVWDCYGNGIKVFTTQTTAQSDNLFRCIAYRTTLSWNNSGSVAGYPFLTQEDVAVGGATGTRLVNCSVMADSMGIIRVDDGGAVKVSNCAFFLSHATSATQGFHLNSQLKGTAAASFTATDYNVYDFGGNTFGWRDSAGINNRGDIAGWRAKDAGNLDVNSVEGLNALLFTDDGTQDQPIPEGSEPDWSLTAGSSAESAANFADTDMPTTGIDGAPFLDEGAGATTAGAIYQAP